MSEANLPFIEDGPANVASGFVSVLVIQLSTATVGYTICRYVAMMHRGTNTVPTEAINLG